MTIKVLLIDDDEVWGKLVDLILSKKGFQIIAAQDAIVGLQKAYATNPDVILLDVMMPGMDGRETCRRFREMSDVPIYHVDSSQFHRGRRSRAGPGGR